MVKDFDGIMAGVCRDTVDFVGDKSINGYLIASQTAVKVNGKSVVVAGDDINPHGDADTPKMQSGKQGTVKIGGKLVCVAGDRGTCSVTHTATGSGDVSIG